MNKKKKKETSLGVTIIIQICNGQTENIKNIRWITQIIPLLLVQYKLHGSVSVHPSPNVSLPLSLPPPQSGVVWAWEERQDTVLWWDFLEASYIIASSSIKYVICLSFPSLYMVLVCVGGGVSEFWQKMLNLLLK